MSFNFVIPEINIGGAGTPPLQFFRRGFNLGGSGSGPEWKDIILHGNTALTLVNAKADSLTYLKLFGGTEQLPEQYLDTVVLSGGCEQRNLPEGYTQLDYLESDGTQYIKTGIKPASGYKVRCKYIKRSGYTDPYSPFGCTSTANPLNAYNGIYRVHGSSTNRVAYGNGVNTTASISGYDSLNTVYDVICNDGVWTINGTEVGTITSETWSADFDIWLFARNTGGSIGLAGYFQILLCQIWDENGNLVFDCLPCKDSSNVLGMYDLVSQTFLTNQGTGTFTAGADVTTPSPDTPIDIVSNNGVVRVSKNLFNENGIILGYFYEDNGTYTSNANTFTSGKIPMNAGTTVTFSRGLSVNNVYLRIHAFNSNNEWIGLVAKSASSSGMAVTGTTPANTSYIRVCGAKKINDTEIDHDCQVELGSTATLYRPYGQIYTDGTVETVTDSVGNTANAQMLLSVGTYKDTQEVIAGAVTRNVGVKVLDGTEDWSLSTVANTYLVDSLIPDNDFSVSAPACVCSHFIGAMPNKTAAEQVDNSIKAGYSNTILRYHTVFVKSSNFANISEFTSYLATQYANGTPVIVVYPISSATTESVSGQFLSKSPVTQTAGAISNLGIAETSSSHTTPTPQQPLQINCNNGVVKVSKNLISTASQYVLLGQFTDASGDIVNSSVNFQTTKFPCQPNTTYTASISQSVTMLRVCTYNSSGTFVQRYNTQVSDGVRKITFTTGASVTQFNIGAQIGSSDTTQAMINAINWQIEKGSTATSYMPYGQIYTDGTTETVEVHNKNLFDKTTNYIEQGNIGTTGSDNASDYRVRTDGYISVKPSTKYTITGNISGYAGASSGGLYLRYYANGVYKSGDGWVDIRNGYTFTTPNDANQLRLVFAIGASGTEGNEIVPTDVTNVQIEIGETATAYQPYFNGGSATAEMLLKVGAYQDVQSVLDGEVTRKVGIKVLDGTENWIKVSAGGTQRFYMTLTNSAMITSRYNVPITHFHFDSSSNDVGVGFLANQILYLYQNPDWTVNEFVAWLADQYVQGSPVIIVYPLATATIETVTAQPLTIQEGTNIVEITQASMDNLELEVSYKAGVAVTITEIENAQLDNNVEVTING